MAVEGLPTALLLEVVTPDQTLVTHQVDEVVAPAAQGRSLSAPGGQPGRTTSSTSSARRRRSGVTSSRRIVDAIFVLSRYTAASIVFPFSMASSMVPTM